MIDNRILLLTQLKKREHEFIGIEKSFKFIKKIQSKSNNFFEKNCYDVDLGILFNGSYSERSDFLNSLYKEFLIDSVLSKTSFCLKLIFFFKKIKLRNNFKQKIGITKKFVIAMLFSLISSIIDQKNSFDEIFFCRKLNDLLIDYVIIDYFYLFLLKLVSQLKTEGIFFSLEKNRFSLKDNLFFLILQNATLLYPLKFSEENETLHQNYLLFDIKLIKIISNNFDLNYAKYLFNMIQKSGIKISLEEYTFFCQDYYNIDFFHFYEKIKCSKILIRNFNKVFDFKIKLNFLLFYFVFSKASPQFFFEQKVF